MKKIVTIQARMSSTRLPGKVMMEFAGHPMLYYVFQRARTATVDKVIVATSTDQSDDPIAHYSQKHSFPLFRGNLEDVLDRFYQAAKSEKANVIVRVTADCPLIDGCLISQGLTQFQKERPDYLSNTVKRTFPRGFDFEIFSFRALEAAWKNAKKIPEREHVTPYIYQTRPQDFKISNFVQPADKSAYQVTVDTPEDYQLLKILVEKYRADKLNCQQIISLLDSLPEVISINANISRKQYGQ